MSDITKAITVKGEVQDVWFRKSAKQKADTLGVTGNVQNLANGDVLILVSGESAKVSELEQWCWEGSSESKVSEVQSSEIQTAPFEDFRILD